MEKLISIIVPIYNKQKTLKRCIDSVLIQTKQEFELLLIDDGSTDDSYNICNEYTNIDNRVRVIKKDNGGPSSARNLGLAEMKGDYLIFVDADDFCEKDFIKTLYDEIVCDDADMVIGRWYIHGRIPNGIEVSDVGKPGIYDGNTVSRSIMRDNYTYGGGFLWNRIINYKKIVSLYGDNIIFDEDLFVYEDKIWILKLLRVCSKIKTIDKVIYHYIFDQNSLSHSVSYRKCENILLAWDKFDDVLSGDLDDEIKKLREEEIMFSIWQIMKYDKKRAADNYVKYKKIILEASKKNLKNRIKAFCFKACLN